MPWPFLLMEPTLSFLALNNQLLSTVLTAVWILVCNGVFDLLWATRHPSCTKLFHIQFFMQNISYTFFWNACSPSNFTHFLLPVIQYHIVHLFNNFWWCCIFWTSFTWIIFKAGTATFKLGSLFLNCWKQRRRVPINFYKLRMNFLWR